MRASEAKHLDFLHKSPQFIIPIYQRTYSWTEKECRQLWNDILRCGRNEKIAVHFIGSIVYIESGLSQVTHQAPLLVIDGQQRLTTVTLMLAALAEAMGSGEPFEGFTQRKVRNYYLVNNEETGDRHFKLLLSQTDKDTLTALVAGTEPPREPSLRVRENHELFRKWAAESQGDLAILCKGLAKLVIVDIALKRDQDNPQLIFESMNSTGKALSQADLIRNFILMGLEPKLQARLYEQYWRPMEVEFGQKHYSAHFDGFIRHYLTVKTGDIPNINAVYEAFKEHAQAMRGGSGDEGSHVEALVKDVRSYARHYCALALNTETEPELKRAIHDLLELKVDVAYPFLLELYQDYTSGFLPKDDFVRSIRLVESYVFRRAICTIPTNSMNKTFATFGRGLRKDRYLESIQVQFLQLPSYRRFPRDEEFHRNFQSRDLYQFRLRNYWLRRLENHGRKEPVPVAEYTIEHILPQNEQLRPEWRTALGEDWHRVQETYLHTAGNLTLTGYNSEYSDRPFQEKRDMPGGFRQSPLKVNEGLGQLETWNERMIQERAARLADQGVKVWAAPQVEASILEAYKPKRESPEALSYSLQDHIHLSTPGIRELFDAFRKEVLAMDACVTEEIFKLYIAYKAETNFVDVVPQARRLRLSLNMRFAELDDPRGICKDVTTIGRWGNGDVEVGMASLDELPYIMGLVRQSLELQLGDGGDA